MAYETQKRDTNKHIETMSNAVDRVADALAGRPMTKTAITSQKPVAQRSIPQRQPSQRGLQQKSSATRSSSPQKTAVKKK